MRHTIFAIILFTCTCAVQALAQGPGSSAPQSSSPQPSAPQPSAPERNSVSVVAVGTLANGSLKGTTSDRHLTFFGVSYNRLLLQRKPISLTFTSMAIPVALLREPFLIGTNFQTQQSQAPFTEIRTSYGLGASPLGVEARFLTTRKVQPFVGFQGGFLYFNRNVLAQQAAQFNFTLDGRAGVRIPIQGEKSISVSYMFQHMSNAYSAVDNPGLDCHMIMVAYTFPIHFGHGK